MHATSAYLAFRHTILLPNLTVAADRWQPEPRSAARRPESAGARRLARHRLAAYEIAGSPRSTGRCGSCRVAIHEGTPRRRPTISGVGRPGCGRSSFGTARRGVLFGSFARHLLRPARCGRIRAIRRCGALALARVAILPPTQGTGRPGDSSRAGGRIEATATPGTRRRCGGAGGRPGHDHRTALTTSVSGTRRSRLTTSADHGFGRAPTGAISHDHR
jgi:hypothetical protein